MVFQGTVLGSPLWNLFVASCCHAANVHLFTEVVFGDDLNSYRKYHSDANHANIFRDLKNVKSQCMSGVNDTKSNLNRAKNIYTCCVANNRRVMHLRSSISNLTLN